MLAKTGRCLVCGIQVEEKPVWCGTCFSPYHDDCFSYNGRCAIYGCTGMRFTLEPTVEPVRWIQARSPKGHQYLQSCIVQYPSTRITLARLAALVSSGFIFILGMYRVLAAARFLSSLGAGLAGLGLLVVARALFGLIAGIFEDHWIVEGKTQTVWLHRRVWNTLQLTAEASFSDLGNLTIRRTRHSATFDEDGRAVLESDWKLFMGVRGRKSIFLAGPVESTGQMTAPEQLVKIARRIARITGQTIVTDPPESLIGEYEDDPMLEAGPPAEEEELSAPESLLNPPPGHGKS